MQSFPQRPGQAVIGPAFRFVRHLPEGLATGTDDAPRGAVSYGLAKEFAPVRRRSEWCLGRETRMENLNDDESFRG